MEDVLVILFVAFLILVLPWILLARSRTHRNRLREDLENRIADLTARIYAVENTLAALRKRLDADGALRPATTSPESPRPAQVRAPGSIPAKVVSTAETQTLVTPPPPPSSRPFPEELVAKLAGKPVEAAKRAADTLVATPDFTPEFPAGPSFFDRIKGGLDLEEMLGTNWLIKISIILFVFGVAFFLAYQLKEVGPGGKIIVGYAAGIALLAGGFFLERSERYWVLGRAALGGGWGMAFFTTYAMGHVEAALIIHSELLDLTLMGIVAAAMVLHSLRYKSQVVTGLAFLLAFSTVTLSQVTVYSLTAGAVLSVGLVIIVLKMRWWELEVFGILAAYINHFYWLRHIIEPMHGHRHSFPEFIPSAAILLLYWLTYRVSYVVRRVEKIDEERLATASALLNSFGLLGLLKYQSVHPEWAFWALLALGTLEIAMGFVAARRRRMAFLVLGTIGVTLLFAAIPFRYSALNVSVLWLAGCEALLFAGIITTETLFRRLSFVAAMACAIQMLGVDGARILGVRIDGAVPWRNIPLGIAFAVAAAVFYFNSEFVKTRWKALFDERDQRALRLISYAAFILAAASLWITFPWLETAPAWALGALALSFFSSRTQTPDLKIQTDLLVLVAFLRAAFVNFDLPEDPGHVSRRMITVGICAAAIYIGSRAKPVYSLAGRFHVPDVYTWLASTLATTLMWYELHSVGIAPAWVLFGLVLVEVGLYRKRLHLRIQGYIALFLGVVRVFLANLAADGDPGTIGPRVYSIVPIIVILFYLYARLREVPPDETPERRFYAADFCGWLAMACLAGLVRYELPVDYVVIGWAALVPVLLAIAWRSGQRLFLHQAVLLTWFAVFRGVMHNLIERSLAPAPFRYSRRLCIGTACALLFASLPLAYKLLRLQPESGSDSRFKRFVTAIVRRPEQTVFFAGFGLVVALLTTEMSKSMLTISWSVCGVITFLFALWLGERSFRLAGLALLLAGVAKIALVDIWNLSLRDKALTFIIMAVALFVVSFLYTRFRETIRQFL